MIRLMEIEKVIHREKGACILLSSGTPASLEITGADVDGLPSTYVLATGSLLVTPAANYLAFEDGVFTQLGA